MDRTPWFERKFPVAKDAGGLPSVIERLEGTPVRLDEKIRLIRSDKLKAKSEGKWSIQEHVGHLLDLEPLWSKRVDDIVSSKQTMAAADLTNRKTHEADHNSSSIEFLLREFRRERFQLVDKLQVLEPADLLKTSLHPRLKTPMGIMDLAYFVAEHDDHHLATITELS